MASPEVHSDLQVWVRLDFELRGSCLLLVLLNWADRVCATWYLSGASLPSGLSLVPHVGSTHVWAVVRKSLSPWGDQGLFNSIMVVRSSGAFIGSWLL
jgi:hypothetical protein